MRAIALWVTLGLAFALIGCKESNQPDKVQQGAGKNPTQGITSRTVERRAVEAVRCCNRPRGVMKLLQTGRHQ
jgi:hypothetical protein